jgi:putative NADPH-quinone reductase
MRCLIVLAHPLENSLCAALAEAVRQSLLDSGRDVQVVDLYRQGFQPLLSAAERASYYEKFNGSEIESEIGQLQWAEAIVLVFPTWWFGFPAILKGWFDRIWTPGVAFDHAPNLGAIRPRLGGLKHMLAITTLGSPWWVDRLIMRRPVRRILKTAILRFCAPQCRLSYHSFYNCENLLPERVAAIRRQVVRAASQLA